MIQGISKHYDKSELEPQTRGRCKDILMHFGLDPELMDGKHDPCPQCGGYDRFRAIDPDNGVLYCNQCFYEKNGDIFAAVAWLLDCSFSEAVNKIGEYLNGFHSQPVKRQEPAPKKQSPAFEDQVQFLDPDRSKFDSWAAHKPPATGEAVEAAGGVLCLWPIKAPQSNRFECVAFPAYRESNSPSGWILYRLDGVNFPAVPNGPGERKTHLLRGSNDGWILFGGRSAVKSAHTVIKVEGIPDALAMYSRLPEGHVVISNVCGSKGASRCL